MKKTGILVGVAGVIAALLILIAMLPAIVSSDTIKPHVLQIVNQRIPGQLQVETWSLRWFGKIQIKGIAYDDRQNNLSARIADLNTSSGLFDLISRSDNLGTVEVVDPHLTYYVTPQPKPLESKTAFPLRKHHRLNHSQTMQPEYLASLVNSKSLMDRSPPFQRMEKTS